MLLFISLPLGCQDFESLLVPLDAFWSHRCVYRLYHTEMAVTVEAAPTAAMGPRR
jgi:hypothetical protein